MTNINGKMLALLRFPFPDVKMQEAITTFQTTLRKRLHGADISLPQLPAPLAGVPRLVARIEELAAKIEEARGLRRLAVEEAEAFGASTLSKIFDYASADFLPDGWRWLSFTKLLADHKQGMTTGPFGTLLQKSEIQSEGVPVLGIANIQANKFIAGFRDYVSPEKANALSNYIWQQDDVVIARSGTVGRSCVIPSTISPNPIMSTNLIRLRLNTKVILPEVMCRLLNGSRLVEQHKDTCCRGSTREFFTQKILFKLEVPTPPLEEQRRIAAYLDDLQAKVDALKQLQAQTQAEIEALLPSVLDKAFKGEL